MRLRREKVALWQAERRQKQAVEDAALASLVKSRSGGGGAADEGNAADESENGAQSDSTDVPGGGDADDEDGWGSDDEDQRMRNESKRRREATAGSMNLMGITKPTPPPTAAAIPTPTPAATTTTDAPDAPDAVLEASATETTDGITSPTFTDAEGETDTEEAKAERAVAMEELRKEMAEDGGAGASTDFEDDEVDPLDAFMAGVTKEVVKTRKKDAERLASDVPNASKSKMGDLMTGGDDGMYSDESDEEGLVNGKKVHSLEDKEKSGYWSGYMPKQRKELLVPDHEEIEYEPFNKEFYVEVAEIAKMEAHEVHQFRCDNEGIRVRGKGCPRPVKSWLQCGISHEMLQVCKRQGYDAPTPIQCQAIPAIMSGRDIMGIAKTGSGKTLAFVIPMFRHILDQRHSESGEGPLATMLTPTRELALQTYNEANRFAKVTKRRVVCVYGGTSVAEQIAELKRGCDICVCTPGRMIDMLSSNSGKITSMWRCTMVILDEADRMFDMGFEPQVMRILDNIRPDRQTIMFSATFPRQMEALARRILKKPIEVQIGGNSVVSDTIEQNSVVIAEEQKINKLLELLGLYQQKGQVLVFVNSQNGVDRVLRDCMQYRYPCLPLHGGIEQQDRDSHLRDFKQGNIRLLIATSVAARGLDVKDLVLVVNYDTPNHYEDYVHRVGRTGRAGREGTAWTFITDDQAKYAGDLIKAYELQGSEPPDTVKALWEKYKDERKAAGKKLMLGGGFGGSGFKFDADEAETQGKKRAKMAKKMGMEQAEGEVEEEEEDIFNYDKELADELEGKIGKLMGNVKRTTKEETEALEAEQTAKAAKELADKKISAADQLKHSMQNAVANVMGGKMGSTAGMSKGLQAAQRAAEIAAKYGMKSAGMIEQIEEKKAEPDELEGVFEEKVIINDWPPEARFQLTRKEHINSVEERCGCAITSRGTFFPKGTKAKPGEEKLYLFIEAKTEKNVKMAKALMERILKDELHREATTYTGRQANSGRYNVLAIGGAAPKGGFGQLGWR
jgi:ATP-dependent RNA helicase DDX46/PRP5